MPHSFHTNAKDRTGLHHAQARTRNRTSSEFIQETAPTTAWRKLSLIWINNFADDVAGQAFQPR